MTHFCQLRLMKCMLQGHSPYTRQTYRYTPLLAWLLIPNSYVKEWGKFLFVLFDVLAAYFIYATLKVRNCRKDTVHLCTFLWLFNPLPIVICSRGNAESLMAVLVLATIYMLCRNTTLSLILAAVFYGLSVHMKLYPITFALPIYLYLNSETTGKTPSSNFLLSKKIFGLDVGLNRPRLIFCCTSISVFLGTTFCCYRW